MESSDSRKSSEKSRGGQNSMSRIVLVQFFVCAFIVVLTAIVCRLGAAEGFVDKYMRLMSEDISVSQVISSAKDVAESVMKPVGEGGTIEIVEKSGAAAAGENEKTAAVETESPAEDSTERTVAQVMSIFSESSGITIPAHGEVSSLFGYRSDPFSGIHKLHSAVDIAVSEGTKVSAAWDGLVTKSGYDETAGNYVWMVHKNGCETLYCHCSEILVSEGDVIRAGETVALSGNTGYSTGPHLHFGVKKDGEMIDPLNYLTVKDGRI